MLKRFLLILLLISVFVFSCKKKDEVQDDYIAQIEQEYQDATNNDVIIESDTYGNNSGKSDSSIFLGDSTGNYNSSSSISGNRGNSSYTGGANNSYSSGSGSSFGGSSSSFGNSSYKGSTSSTISQKRRPSRITVNNFYSPWTSKNDPLTIREIRVMIANREYSKAKSYIDNLDLNNLPSNVDLGQIYQFKGIVHYFLSKSNKSNIAIADEAFKSVINSTKIEKFKTLSLLWNGMLYQTYSTDKAELEKAISLFDQVIKDYPRTRFANDATFYKAVTLKKLGRPQNEYNDLFLSIKRGGFADTLVFSQKANDYVPANALVDSEMLK